MRTVDHDGYVALFDSPEQAPPLVAGETVELRDKSLGVISVGAGLYQVGTLEELADARRAELDRLMAETAERERRRRGAGPGRHRGAPRVGEPGRAARRLRRRRPRRGRRAMGTVVSTRADGRTEGVPRDRDNRTGGHPCADRTHASHHGGCWFPEDPPPGPYWAWAVVDGLVDRLGSPVPA